MPISKYTSQYSLDQVPEDNIEVTEERFIVKENKIDVVKIIILFLIIYIVLKLNKIL